MRESKADEEEQLLLAQYQSMAATTTTAGGKDWEREEGEEWREGGEREGREEVRERNRVMYMYNVHVYRH